MGAMALVTATLDAMPIVHQTRLILLPFRILLVTFVITGLTMAASLMIGLIVTVAWAALHGVQPDVALAYRNIAFPVIRVEAVIVFLLATTIEIRYYRSRRS